MTTSTIGSKGKPTIQHFFVIPAIFKRESKSHGFPIKTFGNDRPEGLAGFTLIEVMVTVAILSLGGVMIFQSNLMSLNVYGRYAHRLHVQNWAEEKVWETKEAILSSDAPEIGKKAGNVTIHGRPYQWDVNVEEETLGLSSFYTIHVNLSWKESGRDMRLSRDAFAMKTRQ